MLWQYNKTLISLTKKVIRVFGKLSLSLKNKNAIINTIIIAINLVIIEIKKVKDRINI